MLHSGLARVPADRKVLFLGRCESPNLLQRGIESLRIAHEAATAKLINTAQNRLQLLSQSYYFPFPLLSPSPKRWSRAGAGRNVLLPYEIYSFLEDFLWGVVRRGWSWPHKTWWSNWPTVPLGMDRWTHPGFPSWEGVGGGNLRALEKVWRIQQSFCCSRCSQFVSPIEAELGQSLRNKAGIY